jgi:hypothetical protein
MRFLFALLFPGWLCAQTLDRQVLCAAAALPVNNGTALSHSLGETVIATATTGSVLLTQGFQQPDFLPLGLPTTEAAPLVLDVFPNPARGECRISLHGNGAPFAAVLRVNDPLGRAVAPSVRLQLSTGKLDHRLDVSEWAAGTYFVSICSAEGAVLETARLTVAP